MNVALASRVGLGLGRSWWVDMMVGESDFGVEAGVSRGRGT